LAGVLVKGPSGGGPCQSIHLNLPFGQSVAIGDAPRDEVDGIASALGRAGVLSMPTFPHATARVDSDLKRR